ncbi:TatD family hydrolase [Psychrobacter submarinus]|jgi:TatD DNase family protein|uniref:TatD family hydrolase n=1 Tax=Psychrobacter submarinus TaxID=154108 RepID=UPI00191ADF49|nr:TatD family hydrolase [Psychrobacter submarinus]
MADTIQSLTNSKEGVRYPLIDTHTHFDAPVFDADRAQQAQRAYQSGVEHLVLVGYLYRHFDRLYEVKRFFDKRKVASDQANSVDSDLANIDARSIPAAHIALGLHPFYIAQHSQDHLDSMADMLDQQRPLAIGEIGLDTFTPQMKEPEVFAKQQRFFSAQLDMAVAYQLPVMLHIRKAHAEALAILKEHDYDAKTLGGIAHSFSGGEQEAKAFVKIGFKLGVTGQVTNPNAKKLRRALQAAVAEYGIGCLVIETDCPDMTPISCQTSRDNASALGKNQAQSSDDVWEGDEGDDNHNRNVPANLPLVLASLSELLAVDEAKLAQQLWQNSINSLGQSWSYSVPDSGTILSIGSGTKKFTSNQ